MFGPKSNILLSTKETRSNNFQVHKRRSYQEHIKRLKKSGCYNLLILTKISSQICLRPSIIIFRHHLVFQFLSSFLISLKLINVVESRIFILFFLACYRGYSRRTLLSSSCSLAGYEDHLHRVATF